MIGNDEFSDDDYHFLTDYDDFILNPIKFRDIYHVITENDGVIA
jgi:hypothetical protein